MPQALQSGTSSASPKAPSARSFITKAIMNPSASHNPDVFPFTNADIGELYKLFSQAKNRGGDLLYHAHDITPAGSHIEWVFGTPGGLTTIQIHITDSHDNAKYELEKHLQGYSQSPDDIFQPAPIDIAKGSICFVSKPTAGNLQSEMIWIRGNIFSSVTGSTDIRTLDVKYTKSIDKIFMDGAHPHEHEGGGSWSLKRPMVEEINVPKQVKVGQEFKAYGSVSVDHIFLEQMTFTWIVHRCGIPACRMYSMGPTTSLSCSLKIVRPIHSSSVPNGQGK